MEIKIGDTVETIRGDRYTGIKKSGVVIGFAKAFFEANKSKNIPCTNDKSEKHRVQGCGKRFNVGSDQWCTCGIIQSGIEELTLCQDCSPNLKSKSVHIAKRGDE